MLSKALIGMFKLQVVSIEFWPSWTYLPCECHTVLYFSNKSLPKFLLLMNFRMIYNKGSF
jgi:hypothetical protein